ncbi:GNAT family N-acetyltransferase [Planctomycetota bacterium]
MICVRRADTSDASTIVNFQVQMAQETEGLTLNADTVTLGVKGLFQHPERGAYWVAEQDDRLVGCLLTIPEWSDWRNATVLWIHSLYVIPAARNQGVWRELYDHLKRLVITNDDYAGLRLYVDKTNQHAREIYGHLGMDNSHYELFEWMKTG